MGASLWFIRAILREFMLKFSHKLRVRNGLDKRGLGGLVGEFLPCGVLFIPIELIGDISQLVLGDFE